MWYVQVPEKSNLVGQVSAGCVVKASAHGAKGNAVVGVFPVPLELLAGQVVRLELTALMSALTAT